MAAEGQQESDGQGEDESLEELKSSDHEEDVSKEEDVPKAGSHEPEHDWHKSKQATTLAQEQWTPGWTN